VFINAVSPKSGAVTLSEHREVKEPATYIFGERRETKNPNRSASNHQPAPAPFFWRGQAEGHWPHRRWPLAAPQVAVGRTAGGSWPHRRWQLAAPQVAVGRTAGARCLQIISPSRRTIKA